MALPVAVALTTVVHWTADDCADAARSVLQMSVSMGGTITEHSRRRTCTGAVRCIKTPRSEPPETLPTEKHGFTQTPSNSSCVWIRRHHRKGGASRVN